MLQQKSVYAALKLGASLSLVILISYGNAVHANDKKKQLNQVCSGFVILPNGQAVLSQKEDAGGQHSAHRHGASHQTKEMPAMDKKGHSSDHHAKKMQGATKSGHQPAHDHGSKAMGKPHQKAMEKSHQSTQGHDHNPHKDHKPGQQTHLMGYRHGQAIVPTDKMMCIPVNSPTDTAWATISSSNIWAVTAESMTGPLAHNSRANERLQFTVMKSHSPATLTPSQVRVFVRMPHHDHRMLGGHGPANDPDVTGIEVQFDQQGRYTLPTLDFSMAGAWLVEMQIKDGAETHRAYFAAHVGEE